MVGRFPCLTRFSGFSCISVSLYDISVSLLYLLLGRGRWRNLRNVRDVPGPR